MALGNLSIDGAIVTYVKAAVGGAAVGTGDGPGFFLQEPNGLAAIFVAIDPTSFLGGVLPGDQLDLTVTEATWVACSFCSACTGANSLPAITAATGTLRARGVTLPAAVDVSNLTRPAWPIPVTQVPWPYGATLITATGFIATAPVSTGDGFSTALLLTDGMMNLPSNDFALRAPDAMWASFQWQYGMKFKIDAKPMWRTGEEADLAGWVEGDVVVSPVVASTEPADGALDSTASTVTLNFSRPIDPATLTMQPSSGPCAAGMSVQLFTDGNQATCAGGTVTLDASQTIATVTPATAFVPGQRYLLHTTGGIAGTSGMAAVPLTMRNGFELRQSPTEQCVSAKQVVISQVYGGGGSPGSLWKNDFIELHNRSSSTIDLAGWSVQYAAAGGTSWEVTPLTGAIAPGAHYLVAEAAGSASASALSSANVAGTIDLASSAGKVILSSSTTPASGACPAIGGGIVDLLAYGGGNSCPSPAAAPNDGTSVRRTNLGCNDTGNPFNDFSVGHPSPLFDTGPVTTCSCDGSINSTGAGAAAGEVDDCELSEPNPLHGYTGPIPLTALPGRQLPNLAQTGSNFFHGQLLQGLLTPTNGSNASVLGAVGVFPVGTNPFTQTVWYPARYDAAAGSADEFERVFAAPMRPGDYGIFYRFSVDGGAHWTWCGLHGNGANAGLAPFDPSDYLPLTVQ